MTSGCRALAALASALWLAACAELAPLRNPPISASDETLETVTTREEAIARLGPPAEVRASDVGDVLVYRRQVSVDVNPNRFYGTDYGAGYGQYGLLLLFLDQDGRVVRRAIERE